MEISKTKVKDFFVKNKMVLSMAFMTVLVLLANHNYNLWFLSMPALLALYSVSSLSEQMCYNVYMAVFSGVSPITILINPDSSSSTARSKPLYTPPVPC